MGWAPGVGALAARHVDPAVPGYFSGAPVIYPPVGALADSAGGWRAPGCCRWCSCWGRRVAVGDRRAACSGGGLPFSPPRCSLCGPTLHLGAFATYDALSVALVALAAWCVVRAGVRGEGTGWMVAAGAALAVANAAAYSSALFDLVVLALALLTALPAGGRLAARRCAVC